MIEGNSKGLGIRRLRGSLAGRLTSKSSPELTLAICLVLNTSSSTFGHGAFMTSDRAQALGVKFMSSVEKPISTSHDPAHSARFRICHVIELGT